MIGRHAGLQCGEDEEVVWVRQAGFRGNLEDGAGAVADVEIASIVEGDTGSDAKAFCKEDGIAFRRDAVDGAVGAGAGVEEAFAVEGEAGGVEQLANEGPDLEIAIDSEDGDGDLLSTRARERGEEATIGVDGGIRDGVKIFSHRDGDPCEERVAGYAFAVQDKVSGDGAFGNADRDSVGAGKGDGGGCVTERGCGKLGVMRAKVSAVNLNLPTGHRRGRSEVMQIRCVGEFGFQETEERGHSASLVQERKNVCQFVVDRDP